jgi:ribonuclease HI
MWHGETEWDFVHRDCVNLGKGPHLTNNMAEYAAVLNAVEWTTVNLWITGRVGRGDHLEFCSDSQLVVNQLQRNWNCSSPELTAYRDLILRLSDLMPVTWRWVPRAQNRAADLMSRFPYMADAGGKKFDKYMKKLEKACETPGV